mgnify:CR=1 FL=1
MSAHTVWLPFPPSVNCLFSTSMDGRRRFPSRRYRTWRKSAGSILMAARVRPTPGSYHLKIKLRAPDKRARDADNHIKAISDLIVAHALVGDDSMAVSVSAEWTNEGLPGAWVTITPAEKGEAASVGNR